MCFSSVSELWYEPSWGVHCGPILVQLIDKGYAQIVLFDVLNVLEVLAALPSRLVIAKWGFAHGCIGI